MTHPPLLIIVLSPCVHPFSPFGVRFWFNTTTRTQTRIVALVRRRLSKTNGFTCKNVHPHGRIHPAVCWRERQRVFLARAFPSLRIASQCQPEQRCNAAVVVVPHGISLPANLHKCFHMVGTNPICIIRYRSTCPCLVHASECVHVCPYAEQSRPTDRPTNRHHHHRVDGANSRLVVSLMQFE